MARDLTRQRAAVDRTAVFVAFLLVIGLTYSDDAVEFTYVVVRGQSTYPRWIVFVVNGVLVVSVALLKWRIEARTAPAGSLTLRQFLPRLAHSWWPAGAALVILVQLAVGVLGSALWVSLLGSALFVLAMSLMLIGALESGSSDPREGGVWARNGWIVPVVIGTLVVQVASALWFPLIDTSDDCADQISTDYFAQMVQVIPLLLITLGIEMGFLRRTGAAWSPGQRAAPILTVVLLCLAEGLAFSMLVTSDSATCGIAATVHEYVAFVLTVQATSIALAAVVWLLMSEPALTSPAGDRNLDP